MNWFSFNSREREYSISITAIAKEFGISRTVIYALLSDAGYHHAQFTFSKLTHKHLEIILLAYAHSIKSLYSNASKNFGSYELREQEELRDFFGKFVRKSFFKPEVVIQINDRILPASNGKIFKSDLDNDLIRDYFFKRIVLLEMEQEIASYQFDKFSDYNFSLKDLIADHPRPSAFIYRQLKIRVRVKHTFTDIKSRIFTTVITGLYYVFSAEEDSVTALLSSIKRCFSAVQQTLGEALNINNSKFTPKWKIKYIPL